MDQCMLIISSTPTFSPIIIFNFNSSRMKLPISLSPNPNLLQKFPCDPDFDITIICGQLKFKLQIAFLYLQSKYFDDIYHQHSSTTNPSPLELDLSYLQQSPLATCLRILYGDQVTITSISELSSLFTVITFLQIDSIKEIILNELRDNLEAWNSIELLEFCYEHKVLKTEILQINLMNDLEILKDPKYSMQLNLISKKTIGKVLVDYYEKCRNVQNEESVRSTINEVLSDYFHNNKVKPEEYWKEENSELLQYIWYEFHPVYYGGGSSSGNNNNMYGSSNSNKSERGRKVKELEERVKELKRALGEREEKMRELEKSNEEISEKLMKSKKKGMGGRVMTEQSYLTVPNVVYKPPTIPISPTSSWNSQTKDKEGYGVEDEEYRLNKMQNISQMKSKQGINRIHTRNQSRGKE